MTWDVALSILIGIIVLGLCVYYAVIPVRRDADGHLVDGRPRLKPSPGTTISWGPAPTDLAFEKLRGAAIRAARRAENGGDGEADRAFHAGYAEGLREAARILDAANNPSSKGERGIA